MLFITVNSNVWKVTSNNMLLIKSKRTLCWPNIYLLFKFKTIALKSLLGDVKKQ